MIVLSSVENLKIERTVKSFTETGWKKKGPFGQKQGKRTVSSKTAFNFLFYCATVSVEN